MTTLRDQISETISYIRRQTDARPEIGIILGTGLGGLAKEIQGQTVLEYQNIPHFPLSTVESHKGRLIFGSLGGKNVVAMQGRFHYYEGYTMQQVTYPVRIMGAKSGLGARTLITSNAVGGMNPAFRKGNLMIVTDHINLQGENPLTGPNDEELGPRFPDMSEPYSKKLIRLAQNVARMQKVNLRRGVLVAVKGPNLETRAEYRMLRMLGADAVGMSTVPEVIVAVHMGMNVLSFSIVTDECFPATPKPVTVDEVIAVANKAEPALTKMMKEVVKKM